MDIVSDSSHYSTEYSEDECYSMFGCSNNSHSDNTYKTTSSSDNTLSSSPPKEKISNIKKEKVSNIKKEQSNDVQQDLEDILMANRNRSNVLPSNNTIQGNMFNTDSCNISPARINENNGGYYNLNGSLDLFTVQNVSNMDYSGLITTNSANRITRITSLIPEPSAVNFKVNSI